MTKTSRKDVEHTRDLLDPLTVLVTVFPRQEGQRDLASRFGEAGGRTIATMGNKPEAKQRFENEGGRWAIVFYQQVFEPSFLLYIINKLALATLVVCLIFSSLCSLLNVEFAAKLCAFWTKNSPILILPDSSDTRQKPFHIIHKKIIDLSDGDNL